MGLQLLDPDHIRTGCPQRLQTGHDPGGAVGLQHIPGPHPHGELRADRARGEGDAAVGADGGGAGLLGGDLVHGRRHGGHQVGGDEQNEGEHHRLQQRHDDQGASQRLALRQGQGDVRRHLERHGIHGLELLPQSSWTEETSHP